MVLILPACGQEPQNENQAQQANADSEDANEWVIQFHQFPEPALVEGFTSPKLGFLKCPPLPPADSSDEDLQKFLRESNDVISHFFEYIGVSNPKGALFVFDPDTFTFAARLPRGAQTAIANLAEAARQQTPKYVANELTIIEADAPRIREIVDGASKNANHRQLLDSLFEAADNGNAEIIATLTQEARSGQRTSIRKQIDTTYPGYLTADAEDWIEYDLDSRNTGLSWELDPVIGSAGHTIDLNFNLETHYAPPRKRQEPISKRGDTELSAAVVDFHLARVTTSITLRDGDAKLVGVWKPENVEGRNDDTLQVAFTEATIVSVLPLPDPRVEQLLNQHGDAIAEIPDGPPQYENLPGELPPGMIVRRFRIPPGFLSQGGGGGGGSPADPFADLGETKFTVRATAKDILMQNGIPFPDGSSANYIASTSELVVRNLPDHIQLVDAYVSSLRADVQKSIGVSVHVVQAPTAMLRRLARESRGWSDHSAAWEQLQDAAEQGDAQILRSVWSEGKSGQRFKVESGREQIYPVGAGIDSGANVSQGKENEAGAKAAAVVADEPRSMSGVFDTHMVGTVVEIDPIIGADGKTLDINLSFEYDFAQPVRSGESRRDDEGNVEMDAPATSFRQTYLATSATMLSGAIRIMGVWEPEGAEEFEQNDVMQAVLLKADILELSEE